MNEERITEFFLKMTSELASLNANMKNVLEKLTQHETRLAVLEQAKFSLKDSLMKYILIALVSAIGIIATLTGSTSIITRILPQAQVHLQTK